MRKACETSDSRCSDFWVSHTACMHTLHTHLFPAWWELWVWRSQKGGSSLSEVTLIWLILLCSATLLLTPLLNYEKVLRNVLLLWHPSQMFKNLTQNLELFSVLFVISSKPALVIIWQLRSLYNRDWTQIDRVKKDVCLLKPAGQHKQHHETRVSVSRFNRRVVDKQIHWPFISKQITLHHKECLGYSVWNILINNSLLWSQ